MLIHFTSCLMVDSTSFEDRFVKDALFSEPRSEKKIGLLICV